jgi:hypothetical protein
MIPDGALGTLKNAVKLVSVGQRIKNDQKNAIRATIKGLGFQKQIQEMEQIVLVFLHFQVVFVIQMVNLRKSVNNVFYGVQRHNSLCMGDIEFCLTWTTN